MTLGAWRARRSAAWARASGRGGVSSDGRPQAGRPHPHRRARRRSPPPRPTPAPHSRRAPRRPPARPASPGPARTTPLTHRIPPPSLSPSSPAPPPRLRRDLCGRLQRHLPRRQAAAPQPPAQQPLDTWKTRTGRPWCELSCRLSPGQAPIRTREPTRACTTDGDWPPCGEDRLSGADRRFRAQDNQVAEARRRSQIVQFGVPCPGGGALRMAR